MKKNLLLLSLAFIAITAFGQNSTPNGNFESWNSVTYDYPQNYPYTSNHDVLYRYETALPFNIVKTQDAHQGSSAIKLTTVSAGTEKAIGYFINTSPDSGDPSTWSGGMPYNQVPTGITGFYKYNVASADSALIFVVFSKAGHNIGTYVSTIGGQHSAYVPFNITFKPALTQTPDSVIFAATSSNMMLDENGVAGSILILDDVSFTGVATQPAMMNGGFESWQSETQTTPATWIMQNSYDQRGNEIRTTDAVKGEYAMELKTYMGENNGVPAVRGEQASTGYYPDNCGGNCVQKGGFPYTNKKDTLTFWYKYAPTSNVKAEVYMNFKKNGSSIRWEGRELSASTQYQFVQIPFDLMETPDTVIINIQSLRWNDDMLSALGSVLTIDEIQFKSQPILYTRLPAFTTRDQFSVFPNPSAGKFRIRNEAGISQVIVYNMLGKQVFSKSNPDSQKLNDIDLTRLKKGVYFMEIYDGTKIYTEKIVIQ
jgi:hypothetical protein